MLIYNITTRVDIVIADDWLAWQLNEHIPEIMSTDLFTDFKIYHLQDQDDSDGITYVIQFFTDAKIKYERYINDYANQLREKAFKKWGNQFIAYRSLLKSVQ